MLGLDPSIQGQELGPIDGSEIEILGPRVKPEDDSVRNLLRLAAAGLFLAAAFGSVVVFYGVSHAISTSAIIAITTSGDLSDSNSEMSCRARADRFRSHRVAMTQATL